MTDAERPLVRRAVPADIPCLVEYRALMMQEMGEDFDAYPGLRDEAAAWFARRMGEPSTFAAFVAELPDAGVVSCAIGTIEDHAPSPRNRSGLRGELANVVTARDFRGRGFARACVTALVGWFTDDTTALTVRLAATPDAVTLYRDLGFREPRDLILQLALAR